MAMEASMSIPNFVYSARFAAAWLVLVALAVTLGLQLLAQIREFQTLDLLPAGLCIQDTSRGANAAPD